MNSNMVECIQEQKNTKNDVQMQNHGYSSKPISLEYSKCILYYGLKKEQLRMKNKT